MDARVFTNLFLTVTKRHNIGDYDVERALKLICVASFKLIERPLLAMRMYADVNIDWENVDRTRGNIWGDSATWFALLDMFDWTHLEDMQGLIVTDFPLVASVRKHLVEVELDPGKGEGWTLACKILILRYIKGLDTLHAVDLLTCHTFKRPTTAACMQFLSKQSEIMSTQDEVTDTMVFLFKHARVNTAFVEQNIAVAKAYEVDLKQSIETSRMQQVKGRPRLRDRLSTVMDRGNVDADTLTVNMWDSYTGFCYKHQFPPTLSESLKMKLYFMACQTNWDWKTHLPKVALGLNLIIQKVASYAVAQPDVPTLCKIIETLSMNGRASFGHLNEFRARCFEGFSVTAINRMNLTQILQLYIAAYQNKKIWKDVWTHFIGTISVKIIRDCEAFVAASPIDAEHLVCILTDKPYDTDEQPSAKPNKPCDTEEQPLIKIDKMVFNTTELTPNAVFPIDMDNELKLAKDKMSQLELQGDHPPDQLAHDSF